MSNIIIEYQGFSPQISHSTYIAIGAKIIGDVTIGDKSSIWFNTIVRADLAPIIIGKNTNIQDNSVIHTSRHKNGECIIGNYVTVGHMAIIHSCYIKDHAFIGMGAIVMDNAIIEEYGFVAAGALISPKKIVKSRELWTGVPAKFTRYLTNEDLAEMEDNNNNYAKLAEIYCKN